MVWTNMDNPTAAAAATDATEGSSSPPVRPRSRPRPADVIDLDSDDGPGDTAAADVGDADGGRPISPSIMSSEMP
ncbi:hypothetical protein TWF281_008817 [Arthrobotrys megalospora]